MNEYDQVTILADISDKTLQLKDRWLALSVFLPRRTDLLKQAYVTLAGLQGPVRVRPVVR